MKEGLEYKGYRRKGREGKEMNGEVHEEGRCMERKVRGRKEKGMKRGR